MTIILNFIIMLLLGVGVLFFIYCFLNWYSSKVYKPTYKDVVHLLEGVINGKTNEYDWDQFICVPIKNNDELEKIRNKCLELEKKEFFDGVENEFLFNKKGLEKLKKILSELKNK